MMLFLSIQSIIKWQQRIFPIQQCRLSLVIIFVADIDRLTKKLANVSHTDTAALSVAFFLEDNL